MQATNECKQLHYDDTRKRKSNFIKKMKNKRISKAGLIIILPNESERNQLNWSKESYKYIIFSMGAFANKEILTEIL